MSNDRADGPIARAAQTQALEIALQRWAADRERISGERDWLVRTAHAHGITKNRIHTLSGIARTTIDDVLGDGMSSETHYRDGTGWHLKHDVYGGPHDEPPQETGETR